MTRGRNNRSARTVLVRADASARIGAGHLVRCLALSDALAARGWRCIHAAVPGSFETLGPHAADGREIVTLDGSPDGHVALALARCGGRADAVIVDHYELGDAFAAGVRDATPCLVRLDDGAGAPLVGDIVINPAPGGSPDAYADGAAAPRVLLGPKYALLRPEFAHRRADPRRLDRVARRRILVTLGASAPTTRVLRLAAELATLDGVTVEAIGGSDAAGHVPPVGVELAGGWIDTAAAIARADLVVSAAGGTVWERCCLGVPGIAVILADNQRRNAAALDQAGAATVLGDLDALVPGALSAAARRLLGAPDLYASMAAKAWALCDGYGTVRAVRAIDPPLDRDGAPVFLRPATPSDIKTLFAWQIDPRVRAYFRNPDPPTWPEHAGWFADRLGRPDCAFYIVESGRRPAGALRAERGTDGWEVSILVDPDRGGRGIGRSALALLGELMPRERLLAQVAPANAASRRMFLAAGYAAIRPEWYAREAAEVSI